MRSGRAWKRKRRAEERGGAGRRGTARDLDIHCAESHVAFFDVEDSE